MLHMPAHLMAVVNAHLLETQLLWTVEVSPSSVPLVGLPYVPLSGCSRLRYLL